MLDQIKDDFTENIQTQIAALDTLGQPISKAAMLLIERLLNGNKILCCGNGGSAANVQHFTACLLNRFETERPSLPALTLAPDPTILSAIANDYHFDEVFSKQVRAFGQPGDILLALSTHGNNANIINAMQAAVTRDMAIIALTGHNGGEMTGLLGEQDVEIRIPSSRPARIQESHLITLNILCALIDSHLFLAHGV
ncbi:MAG: SIS domain-containing protein [Enterovibrio sp.]